MTYLRLNSLDQITGTLVLWTCQAYFTVSDKDDFLEVMLIPFEDPTKFQTEEDRAIIRNLIEGYMTDKRTIIL